MKTIRRFVHFSVLGLLLTGGFAQPASITGTVTNETTGKPSAGDSVVLVDVRAGMSDASTTKTDSHGRYSLDSPGGGAFLIRVDHQGGTYFIAAPQGGAPGDVTVYDVAPKVDGVGIDADMIFAEGAPGTLRVQERYLVRNTSLPPRAQFSSNTFEFVLPDGAILDAASATRPGGLPTNTRPSPLAQKGHYTINIPIQPNKGDKETLFELQYHLAYSGKTTFAPQPQMPTDNLVVSVPKSMNFKAGSGSDFQSVQQDSRVQTFVTRNIHPGQAVGFTVSGEGQMPPDAQTAAVGQPADSGMGATADTGSRPGGGIGTPIDTPDPLTKYKWWILGTLMLAMVTAGAVFLRRQAVPAGGVSQPETPNASSAVPLIPSHHFSSSASGKVSSSSGARHPAAPPSGNIALLNILKDELFALEKEKLSGEISPAEYAEVKAGLEAVLKRALSNSE